MEKWNEQEYQEERLEPSKNKFKQILITALVSGTLLGTFAIVLNEQSKSSSANQPVIIFATAVPTELAAKATQIPQYSHTNTCMVNAIPQTLANSGWTHEGIDPQTGLKMYKNPFTIAVLGITRSKLSLKPATSIEYKIVDKGFVQEDGVTKDEVIKTYVMAENCSQQSAEEVVEQLQNGGIK